MTMELAAEIADGKHDNELDWLIGVITDRRKTLRKLAQQRQLTLLKPGDSVRFTPDVRPKYLGGRIGTVQSKRGTKLVVDLEVPAGRYSTGVVVPADLLEPA